MTFIELESAIRDYRESHVIHRSNVLIVPIPIDNFSDIWGWIKPEYIFYEDGRRRIRYIVWDGKGYSTLNILQPNPDDAHGSWEDATVVTWQQVCLESVSNYRSRVWTVKHT